MKKHDISNVWIHFKKNFIGLLCFGESLASNHRVAKSEGLIKSVSLNN